MSSPIRQARVEKNLLLRDQYLKLSARSKKTLLKQLSSDERKIVLKIIKKNGDVSVSQKKWDKLDDRLKIVSQLPTKLTRKDKNQSLIAKIKISLGHFADNVAYLFNFLTADKANRLIKRVIIKSDRKVSLNTLPWISNSTLEKIIEKNKQPPLDLAKALIERGFSTELKRCELGEISFKDIQLDGITFTDCKFNWTKFGDSNLTGVTFNHCDIFNLSLIGDSKLSDCMFEGCEIRETMFIGSHLTGVVFKNCEIISSSFEDSTLQSCLFQNNTMAGTHFFESNIRECNISNCNLKNTVFFDTFSHFIIDDESQQTAIIDRPTTALLVDPENVGITVPKTFLKLDKSSQVLPLRIAINPQKTTKDNVNNEVEAALNFVGPYDPNQPPIPQRLIHELAKNPDSDAALILMKSEKLALSVNSIFLPGGEDLPSGLYGQDVEHETEWGGDYRRSILELGLVHQSFNKGIPLMALCRGFQVANVYFGAQLIQDVKGHIGIQNYKLNNPEKIGLYAEVLKTNIIGAVAHHQGVPVTSGPTEHLEAKVIYEGLIKASELKDSGSVPMILLQFHPELYKAKSARSMERELIDKALDITMSDKNEIFWNILYHSAKAYENKRELGTKIKFEDQHTRLKEGDKTQIETRRTEAAIDANDEYYRWKIDLFNKVTERVEYFLPIYLAEPGLDMDDTYLDEREAIEKALRYDDQFIQRIMGFDNINRDSIIDIIQGLRPELYDELSESSLAPYIL